MAAIVKLNCRRVRSGRLSKKLVDQPATVFVFDPGEQPGAELSDGFRFIKRQTIVHLPAVEVTRHALRLEDWLYLTVEVDSRFRV